MDKFINLAIHYAKCSELAYLDSISTAQLAELGYNKATLIDVKNAQVMVFENSDTITLAFRGTEIKELQDVVADLKAWKHRAQSGVGRVHDGFYDEIKKVWDGVVTYIDKGKNKNKTLNITGHSLGGGMATIAASRLKSRVNDFFTYGSPRVGNKEWVKNNSELIHHRFVNNNDIVPKVPLAIMGYRHHGTLEYINYYGEISRTTWWRRVKDGCLGRFKALMKGQKFDGFYDHSINEYVRSLTSPILRK